MLLLQLLYIANNTLSSISIAAVLPFIYDWANIVDNSPMSFLLLQTLNLKVCD
jgi:hypothetical protein